MKSPLTIASIGEPMIELARSPAGPLTYDRRYGGDTLNTALYLARLLEPQVARVHYVTRLGDDPLSDWMIEGFESEGIYVSYSSELGNPRAWSAPARLISGGEWYPQVAGLEPGGTDSEAGELARFFLNGRSNFFIHFTR